MGAQLADILLVGFPIAQADVSVTVTWGRHMKMQHLQVVGNRDCAADSLEDQYRQLSMFRQDVSPRLLTKQSHGWMTTIRDKKKSDKPDFALLTKTAGMSWFLQSRAV